MRAAQGQDRHLGDRALAILARHEQGLASAEVAVLDGGRHPVREYSGALRRMAERGLLDDTRPLRPGAITWALTEAGRQEAARRAEGWEWQAVRRYRAGESVTALAGDLGKSASSVQHALRARGVELRGWSEGQRLRAAREREERAPRLVALAAEDLLSRWGQRRSGLAAGCERAEELGLCMDDLRGLIRSVPRGGEPASRIISEAVSGQPGREERDA